MFRTLEAAKIEETLQKLKDRISTRFPGSGLSQVCVELIEITRETEARIAKISRPHYILRFATLILTAAGLALLAYLYSIIEVKRDAENLYGVMQGIDSAFNLIIVMGAAIIFLSSLEARWKRHKAIEHLHELRSIIHIIDMHQLPKDPSATRAPTVATAGPGSQQRPITAFELTRYLDYCAELLSLSAKVAALYAQSTRDPIVIDEASDLGQITSNMSNKIWQKITIAQALAPQPSVLPVPVPASGAGPAA